MATADSTERRPRADVERRRLSEHLTRLRTEVLAAGDAPWDAPHAAPDRKASAQNLRQYLALRRHDLREFQLPLTEAGLSSLGGIEGHVQATLDSVLEALGALLRSPASVAPGPSVGVAESRALLSRRTAALLGPPPAERSTRIMVTMPSEAARDPALVRSLLTAGMDVMRINCAHDAPAAWQEMVLHLRRAESSGRSARIAVDLPGPKLRTGPLPEGPAVLRLRPKRNAVGEVTAPAQVTLVADAGPGTPPPARALAVPAKWLDSLREGDEIEFTDARGEPGRLLAGPAAAVGRAASTGDAAYITPGCGLILSRTGAPASVGSLPRAQTSIRLRVGDTLVLTRGESMGRDAEGDSSGQVVRPAEIGCSLEQAFDAIVPGQQVWFDDGKIGGVAASVRPSRVEIAITDARPGGSRLKADKGINLPDSELDLSALGPHSSEALRFAAEYADMVGLSFVSRPEDVAAAARYLDVHAGPATGLILKVETRRAFERLPELLLEALRTSRPVGIMIARGDLAVECGYERLAEVQEEILWLAEAAHLPVIWATQVLDRLAKTGRASRAEITDAAIGVRAECVMLNKGPRIVQAISALDDILRRMGAHQDKKQYLLRRLTAFGASG